MIIMRIIKDREYYYIEIENKEDLEKLKEDIVRKIKEKQNHDLRI